MQMKRTFLSIKLCSKCDDARLTKTLSKITGTNPVRQQLNLVKCSNMTLFTRKYDNRKSKCMMIFSKSESLTVFQNTFEITLESANLTFYFICTCSGIFNYKSAGQI